jgi:hypothetical protein
VNLHQCGREFLRSPGLVRRYIWPFQSYAPFGLASKRTLCFPVLSRQMRSECPTPRMCCSKSREDVRRICAPPSRKRPLLGHGRVPRTKTSSRFKKLRMPAINHVVRPRRTIPQLRTAHIPSYARHLNAPVLYQRWLPRFIRTRKVCRCRSTVCMPQKNPAGGRGRSSKAGSSRPSWCTSRIAAKLVIASVNGHQRGLGLRGL